MEIILKDKRKINLNLGTLARDHIPALLECDGYKLITKKLHDKELDDAFADKLIEYSLDYKDNQTPENLVNLYDIVVSLLQKKGIEAKDFAKQAMMIRYDYGGFKDGIKIEDIEKLEIENKKFEVELYNSQGNKVE